MAAVRLLPRLLKVIVALEEVAVNLYQTPFVVVDVAPPQAPVGDALIAPCRSPVVVLQVTDGVNVAAVAQVDCELANAEILIKIINNTAVRAVVGNMVFQDIRQEIIKSKTKSKHSKIT